MKLKQDWLSQEFISQLSDWDLLSAWIYCRKVLNRESFIYEEEFYDLCFFFFDGDEQLANKILQDVEVVYKKEYLKRHGN